MSYLAIYSAVVDLLYRFYLVGTQLTKDLSFKYILSIYISVPYLYPEVELLDITSAHAPTLALAQIFINII